MAGEAKTNKFMIGDATVMIGPMADVFNLMPDKHSVGLAKNFAVQVETGSVDLTQGLSQTPVMSVRNQFNSSASCEVYEYTARNLAYGLGLDASGAAYDEYSGAAAGALTLATQIAASATPGAVISLTTGQGANVNVGDWLVMQQNDDYVFAAKVLSKATDAITFDRNLPANLAWAVATTRIFKSNAIGAAPGDNVFLSAKVAIITPKDKRPAVVLFPKIRITRGFNMALGSSDFSNLPFEFQPYPLVAEDALYASFGKNEVFKVLPA